MAIEHFLQTSMDLYEALDSNLPEDKVVLVGNPGVGKSTIFQRFKTGKFVREEELTHHDKDGQECYKAWTVGEQQVSMTLYDTAGVERYTQTIPPTYYRRAKVVLLVYSVDNCDSFHAISSNWIDNTSSTVDENSITALVGNKCDLEEGEDTEQFVSRQRALTLATNLEIDQELVFEISALSGNGFRELFDSVAVRMHDAMVESSHTSTAHNLNTDTRQHERCRC